MTRRILSWILPLVAVWGPASAAPQGPDANWRTLSTTHFRVSAEDLSAAGITEGTIRLSVGLEDADDLIEDLSRALYAAGKS